MPDGLLSHDDAVKWWRETGEWELRQLLLWRWDPIGVQDSFPNTVDEYDDYVVEVRDAAAKGRAAVITCLRAIETSSMELDPRTDGELDDVAVLLTDWFVNSTASWKRFGPPRH